MKKRLRKKKRVGEFQEFGFAAGFRFSNGLETKTRNDLIDRFISQAIEDNGLQFGGGGDFEWAGFVALNKNRGSTLNHHREAVKKWFIQEPKVLEYYVNPMIDAWYGDFDNIEKQWVNKEKALLSCTNPDLIF